MPNFRTANYDASGFVVDDPNDPGIKIGTDGVSIVNTKTGATISAGGEIASYTGQIATRSTIPNALGGSNKWIMSLSHHFARDGGTTIKIGIPNFVVNSAGGTLEAGTGGTATFTAAYQAPNGTTYQFKFGGSASGVAANGSVLYSDILTVPAFLAGDAFIFRIWGAFASQCAVTTVGNSSGTALGDQLILSTVALPDQTLSGTITGTTGPDFFFTPCAIIGTTSKRSFAILGDSRQSGDFDVYDRSGNLGQTARGIGAMRAYLNLSVDFDLVQHWVSSNAIRLALTQWCSDAIVVLGINDIYSGGRTSAQVLADLITMYGLLRTAYPNMRIWGGTLAPAATSTDSFATVANQTSVNASIINATNLGIRATPPTGPLSGFIEFSDQDSSSRDSCKWQVNGIANYYVESGGIHDTNNGYLKIMASSVVRNTVGI